MAHPTYQTKNGNPVRAYHVEASGIARVVDDCTLPGTSSVVGSFVTAEEAIAAAKAAKRGDCRIEVVNTRGEDGNETIFTI